VFGLQYCNPNVVTHFLECDANNFFVFANCGVAIRGKKSDCDEGCCDEIVVIRCFGRIATLQSGKTNQ